MRPETARGRRRCRILKRRFEKCLRRRTPLPLRGCSRGSAISKERTIAEIANETKIKSDYLTALENEDYGSLPQPVYVLGYVRKLCSLYHVSPERADQITAELRDRLEYEVPEDITKTVIDHEVSEENERKIRQLILILAASALLVAVVLVAGGILILAGLRSSGSSPEEPRFTESQAVEVQDAPKLIITELIP